MVWTLLEETVVAGLTSTDESWFYLTHAVAALSHPVRRRVLSILTSREACERDELVEQIAADDDVDISDHDRIELLLHHVHLPKLAQAQYVDYDPRNGDVVLWRDPKDVDRELLTDD